MTASRFKVSVLTTSTFVATLMVLGPLRLAAQGACAEGGSVYGTVASQTGTAVAGATVLASWDSGQAEGMSGADGGYELCGLPASLPVSILVASETALADPVVIELPSADRFEFDLTVFVVGGDTGGLGGVMGTAVDANTGAPIVGARVSAPVAGVDVVTNAEGAFRLNRLPAGTQTLVLEHVGYGSRESTVEVTVDRSAVVRLVVEPQAIEVAPLEVVVEGTRLHTLETRGFYERKEWAEATGVGHFFTEDDIERRGARLITQLIADVPGTDLDCRQASRALECQVRLIGSSCPRADVYIDGARVIRSDNQISRQMLDDLVRPHEIAGVEVHMGGASLSGEFASGSGNCGVVAIWTR